jgi:hypothetical protein
MGQEGMGLKRVLRWLIGLAVAAGLLAAPLAVPAIAATHAVATMGDMQMMADDMPCCPDQQEQKAGDCGACALMALCVFNVALPLPDAAVLADRQPSRRAFALPDDLLIDGLGEHPPDQPPRNVV